MSNPLTDIQEGEPTRVVAGDTWVWKRTDLASDYPLASYTLTYALRREGDGTVKTITAAEASDTYTVTVPATDSNGYAAGVWKWQAYMTRTSDSARVTLDSGTLVVEANGATAADPRTHARKVLDALEARIEGRVTKDVNNYSIGNRSIALMSMEELMAARSKYRREVARENINERARKGLATGRTEVVRFRD